MMKLLRKAVFGIVLALLLISVSTLTFSFQPVKADCSWIWVGNTVTGTHGEAVVGTGEAIYIARGTRFYRYTPSNDSFVELASPPKPDGDAFETGTALAWDFNNFIYALYGASSDESRRWFYRYSISSNDWEALANTPADQGEGDALAWVDGSYNCLYATIGGEQRPTFLMRYHPSNNTWEQLPVSLPGMGDGASMVWAEGDCLYILRGEYLETEPLNDFWCYNITSNTLTELASIPAYPHSGGVGGVGDGGSLLYIGFWMPDQKDYIYALSGNQAYPEPIPDNRTYRYTISTNSWERLADLPFGIGYYVGCRLGYADGHIYAWQGAPSTWAGGGDDLAKYVLSLLTHDLAIKNVTLSSEQVYVGKNVTITVYFEKKGTATESVFCIEVRADSVFKEGVWFLGVSFNPGDVWSYDFTWNTSNATCGNYTIISEIKPLPDEINTADNVYILNFTINPDYEKPRIETPIQDPPSESVQPFQNVKVKVNVTDYESGVRNVTLCYSVNYGEWKTKPMTLNETLGLYEAEIEGYEAETTIAYYIVAYDNAGNREVSDNNGYCYQYHVIPELPLNIILPLFMLTTVITTVLLKKKIKPKP